MKSIDEAEAQARLDEILEEAQRQPIVIRRQGKDVAAMVSITDYERLRLTNIQSFFDLRKDVAGEATMSGLTEERLAELLSDRDL
jgi:prevent-host-death family protein